MQKLKFTQNEIDILIKNICSFLEIPKPKIIYDTSTFKSNTMMAQINIDQQLIYIKKSEINIDHVFAILHELRHLWQAINDYELYLSNYKTVDFFDNIEEYNLQPAEIDANAFAGLTIMNLFHLKPLFIGFPDKVKSKIYDRIETIKKLGYR